MRTYLLVVLISHLLITEANTDPNDNVLRFKDAENTIQEFSKNFYEFLADSQELAKNFLNKVDKNEEEQIWKLKSDYEKLEDEKGREAKKLLNELKDDKFIIIKNNLNNYFINYTENVLKNVNQFKNNLEMVIYEE